MTEYEINLAVAEKLKSQRKIVSLADDGKYVFVSDIYGRSLRFDPCNNAQQAWEIMLANNISVTKDGDWYFAFNAFDFTMGHMEYYPAHKRNIHEKPFVAAMLLFLEI